MTEHNIQDIGAIPRFYSVQAEQIVQRPPTFSGDDEMDPMDFIDAFEASCDWNNWITDARKLAVVRQCLKGSAKLRMENFHSDAIGYREGGDKSFFSRFRKEYVTESWRVAYRKAFSRREQLEGEAASKYLSVMLGLWKRANPTKDVDNPDVIEAVRGGLLPNYIFYFKTFARLEESKGKEDASELSLAQLSQVLKNADDCTFPRVVRSVGFEYIPRNLNPSPAEIHVVGRREGWQESRPTPFESRINARLQKMEDDMVNFMDRLETRFASYGDSRAQPTVGEKIRATSVRFVFISFYFRMYIRQSFDISQTN